MDEKKEPVVTESKERTGWGKQIEAAGIVLGLMATSAAGGWYVRQDRVDQLERDVQRVEASAEWAKHLPKLTSGAVEATSRLEQQLARLQKNEELEAQLRAAEEKLTAAEEKVAGLETEREKTLTVLAAKEKLLRDLDAPQRDFELRDGQSEIFTGGTVVGVTSLYSTDVTLNVDNASSRLEPGNYIDVPREGASCRVVFRGVDSDSLRRLARFTLTCPRKAEGSSAWEGAWLYEVEQGGALVAGELVFSSNGERGLTGTFKNGRSSGTLRGEARKGTSSLDGTWTNERGQAGRFSFELCGDGSQFVGNWSTGEVDHARSGSSWIGRRKR